MKLESTYGTAVTVDRFYPYLDGIEGDWDPRLRQGSGLRGGIGRVSPLGARNFPTYGQGSGKIKYELESQAGGVLHGWALGVSTVTAITGGSQQVFHCGITGTFLPSATIQMVKVSNAGVDYVQTMAGCTATKVLIEQPDDDIATIEVEFDYLTLSTVTAAATPSYAAAPTQFDAWQGAIGLGGTLSVPTTTALASGLTAFTAMRSWKLEIDQGVDDGRWVIGGRNRPTAGTPKIKFSAKADFDSTTLSAALIAGTKLPFYQTWTTTEVVGSGFAQLQVVVPQIVLSKGLAKVKPGDTVTQDISGSVVNDGTNEDCYVVVRTVDVAL